MCLRGPPLHGSVVDACEVLDVADFSTMRSRGFRLGGECIGSCSTVLPSHHLSVSEMALILHGASSSYEGAGMERENEAILCYLIG